MRTFVKLLGMGAVALAASVPASAATLTSVDGAAVYVGPAPTFDFDVNTPTTSGGTIQTGSNAQGAQPLGSTGNYFTVGPDTSPAFIDLSSFAGIASLSFIWGSVDDYNDIFVIARDGSTVLGSWNGTQAATPANGDQTAVNTNPLVTISFFGTEQGDIGGLRLRSSRQAFEIDNISIAAVPEPSTWAMLILGFGLLGGSLRARSAQAGRAHRELQQA